jgi:competence protein ComEC
MRKRFKVLLSSLIILCNIIGAGFSVKADTNTATQLLNDALQQKTFYHYNMAYFEIMKLQDESLQAELLGKLGTIGNAVWTKEISDINAILHEMVRTSSGRIYDSIQVDINNANIHELDKHYLLGEVTSWGRRLVWTSDYTAGVQGVVDAWTNMDTFSINNAENVVGRITNQYSKEYLLDEIAGIKAAFSKRLKVHYIDVGQADAILIQQGNSAMLIDGGNNADKDIVKNYLDKEGITFLEYIIGTHAHEDHIGGLDYIINSFKVGKVYFPKQTATTETFRDFVNAVKDNGLQLTVPSAGEAFKLGEALVTVVAPNSEIYNEANDYSIVTKVTFGSNSFLFTGDAETVSENEIINKGTDIKADVLKVGHHGSYSSTSELFLNRVAPKYAVISLGKDNSYGHPHQQTMDKLRADGIAVFRTDENGTVIATSNGKDITFNAIPGSYNSADNTGSEDNTAENPEPVIEDSTSENPEPVVTELQYVDANGKGLIKGNISSSKEKIYHLPGGAYYNITIAEEFFKTVSEAENAGYRRSSR